MNNHILLIGAHFDDVQCGSAAGLCRKLTNRGWKATILNLFAPPSFDKFDEINTNAAAQLGANCINWEYQVLQDINNDPVAIRRIAATIREINPQIICLPWPDDNHYDHSNAARAALKAISYMNVLAPTPAEAVKPKLTDILAFEISSWQTRNFSPDFYIDVTTEMPSIVAALNAFTNLEKAGLEWYQRELTTRRENWGVRANCNYAEAMKYIGPQFPIKSPLNELLGDDLRPAGFLQYPIEQHQFG